MKIAVQQSVRIDYMHSLEDCAILQIQAQSNRMSVICEGIVNWYKSE